MNCRCFQLCFGQISPALVLFFNSRAQTGSVTFMPAQAELNSRKETCRSWRSNRALSVFPCVNKRAASQPLQSAAAEYVYFCRSWTRLVQSPFFPPQALDKSSDVNGWWRRAAELHSCRRPTLSVSKRHLAEGKWRNACEMASVVTQLLCFYCLSSQSCFLFFSLCSHACSLAVVPLLSFSLLSPSLQPRPASCPQPGAVTQGFGHRHRGFEPRGALGPAAPLIFIPVV